MVLSANAVSSTEEHEEVGHPPYRLRVSHNVTNLLCLGQNKRPVHAVQGLN
jgi:hypothetical protein